VPELATAAITEPDDICVFQEGVVKMRMSFVISLLIITVLSACSGAQQIDQPTPIPPSETPVPTNAIYSLLVSADPSKGGVVAPPSEQSAEGSIIQIQALPAPGYEFTGWSGDAAGSSPNVDLVMDENKELIAHFSPIVTPTPKPTLTPTTPPCKKPADVTVGDVGKVIEVCGKVTNFGSVPCPECAWGGYGFLKLDKEFLIISYEWEFNEDWKDACILVGDTIELLGNKPVIVYTYGEGMPGADCEIDPDTGQLRCSSGDYFVPWSGCD
jgi:uncharacterized repeat protein (TIGR02543 family)